MITEMVSAGGAGTVIPRHSSAGLCRYFRWRDGHWLAGYCGQCDFRYFGAGYNPPETRR